MKVQDVKAGYLTPWYEVMQDAKPLGDEFVLVVQFPDGGHEVRTFDKDVDIPGRE